jgi:hypothetical protein
MVFTWNLFIYDIIRFNVNTDLTLPFHARGQELAKASKEQCRTGLTHHRCYKADRQSHSQTKFACWMLEE